MVDRQNVCIYLWWVAVLSTLRTTDLDVVENLRFVNYSKRI